MYASLHCKIYNDLLTCRFSPAPLPGFTATSLQCMSNSLYLMHRPIGRRDPITNGINFRSSINLLRAVDLDSEVVSLLEFP